MCVWDLYTSMYQECVCSFNYAAMYNLVCYLNSTSTVHWFFPLVFAVAHWLLRVHQLQALNTPSPSLPVNGVRKAASLCFRQLSPFLICGPSGSLTGKKGNRSHSMNLIFLFCSENFLNLQLAVSKKKVQYHTSSVSNISISINDLNVDTCFFLYISSKLLKEVLVIFFFFNV